MQKIYVGNKPIVLSTKVEKENNFKNLMIDSIDIHRVLNLLKKEKYNSIRLIGSDPDELLDSFLKLLPNVVAGGGKVLNSSGHILFIYRNGKWDLPKGKTEPNETIDQTALREVKEETGKNNITQKWDELRPVGGAGRANAPSRRQRRRPTAKLSALQARIQETAEVNICYPSSSIMTKRY